jgi:hypothetical protein
MACALAQVHILKEIFACIGPGCYVYLAINKQWKALTAEYGRFTYYKSALSSAACLTQALAAGLDLESRRVARVAGRHCSTQMLDAAHAMGLEWSDIISLAAVSDLPKLRFLILERNCPMHTGALAFAACKSNSADTLQWLHSMGEQLTEDHFCRAAHFNCVAAMAFLYSIGCQAIPSVAQEAAACPSAEPLRWLLSSTYYKLNPAEDSLAAARGGSVQVLQFLQPLAHWNAQMLTQLLQAAGAHKRLAAAQWLREQGAAWPVRLQDRWGKQWRGPCLEWARSEGCDSPV